MLRRMRSRGECRDCLGRLVDLTVELATADEALREAAREAAGRIIAQEFSEEAIPALLATRFHQEIKRLTGNPDPFAALKQRDTAFLRELFQKVAPGLAGDLESLLKLSALGNGVDFFRSLEEVAAGASPQVTFALSHLAAFQELLSQPPGLLLFLADNAGEQYFDLPLLRHLRSRGWQAVYVVKGGPIQNDLTLGDLKASGLLEDLSPVWDTGAETVGLVPEQASPAFQEAWATARLIVAKGMGHFETLGHLTEPRIFYLLQAKCRPVAEAIGVDQGSLVFFRSGDTFP